MYHQNEESEGTNEEVKIVCHKCDSELIIGLDTCPICGSELPSKKKLSENERTIKKKITLLYNLVFWAEDKDLDTLYSYKLIRQAREELEVGDLTESKKCLKNAIHDIFDPFIKTLYEEINGMENENKDRIPKEQLSQLRSLVKKAESFKKDDELEETLSVLNLCRKKIERYRSV